MLSYRAATHPPISSCRTRQEGGGVGGVWLLTSRFTRSFFRPERLLSARPLCAREELAPPADGGIVYPEKASPLFPSWSSGCGFCPAPGPLEKGTWWMINTYVCTYQCMYPSPKIFGETRGDLPLIVCRLACRSLSLTALEDLVLLHGCVRCHDSCGRRG